MRKIRLSLIGIGSGNPDHLTLQGLKAMRRSDLILLPQKGDDKSDLLALRHEICDEHLSGEAVQFAEFNMPVRDPAIENYKERVEKWHDHIAQIWCEKIDENLDATHISLLIWGDPSLYDSALRIAARLENKFDFQLEMIAGITSIQALTAAHHIPLNDLGAPFMVTTGRNLRDHGWPKDVTRIVIMLDGENSFQFLEEKSQIQIFWTAYAGMKMETSVSGLLSEKIDEIMALRNALQKKNGWIMDIYLLDRNPNTGQSVLI